MSSIKVLHIIDSLSRGGAGRMLITLAKLSREINYRVISLRRADDHMKALASEAGLAVIDAPTTEVILQAVAEADIVVLDYWNTPEIMRFCALPLPPARLIVWLHVGGIAAPHCISRELYEFADIMLVCTPYSYQHPLFSQLKAEGRELPALVYPPADFSRLSDISLPAEIALPVDITLQVEKNFNIGYIGTLDFVKLHPQFIELCAAIKIPNARFTVCGSGRDLRTLIKQSETSGIRERFEFINYHEDIKWIIGAMDIFGYPLCEDNYSGAELILQEIQYLGLPSVVLAYGGAQEIINHGYSGLVAKSLAEYIEAIEYLYENPDKRAEMSENARHYAWETFRGDLIVTALDKIYASALLMPKRARHWQELSRLSGSELFLFAAGNPENFQISRYSEKIAELFRAETEIARSSPVICNTNGGGLFHYRGSFVDDLYLKLWCGLTLLYQKRPALALSEFHQAIVAGFNHWRIYYYYALVAQQAGAPEHLSRANRLLSEHAPKDWEKSLTTKLTKLRMI